MVHGIYQMTPRQYRKAIDAGVFGDKRVELLGGIPFVMTQNPPHALSAFNVQLALVALGLLPQWMVAKDYDISLGSWQPMPDVVIFRGPKSTYRNRLPRGRDVALLAEISDTTYAKDSGPKLRRYATFRIPVYWIVNLNRRIVEVRTGPFGKGKQAGYAHCDLYREGDLVPVELDGQEVGRVAVTDLLP